MGRRVQTVIWPLCLVGLLAGLAGGCGSSERSTAESDNSSAASDIRTFEQDFHPSDYDRMASTRHTAAGDTTAVTDTTESAGTGTDTGELVQGFRVQIFSTSNIDAAKSLKEEAELKFPSEWFYVEYDPPAYKIRAGNFLTRMSAEKFRNEAQERGYRGAWVVPGKVFKQPPPPPPRSEAPQPQK